MIQKSWNDKKINKFCRENKYTQVFNSAYKELSVPVYVVTNYKDRNNSELQRVVEWCKEHCLYRFEICQWHLGYENNIFLKFFSRQDYTNYDRFYDRTFLPRIDVEVRAK
jgi:hypothetical protein